MSAKGMEMLQGIKGMKEILQHLEATADSMLARAL